MLVVTTVFGAFRILLDSYEKKANADLIRTISLSLSQFFSSVAACHRVCILRSLVLIYHAVHCEFGLPHAVDIMISLISMHTTLANSV